MTKATKYKDAPHARIYKSWLTLPAWKAMRREAQLLFVHMLADYHPDYNPTVEWSLTRVQKAIVCGRRTASEALTDLEKNGWISVAVVGRFAGARRASRYRFNHQYNREDMTAPSNAFLRVKAEPRVGRRKNQTGSNNPPSRCLKKPGPEPTKTDAVMNEPNDACINKSDNGGVINTLPNKDVIASNRLQSRVTQLLKKDAYAPSSAAR